MATVVGQPVTLTFAALDTDGTPVHPDTAVLTITRPDGTTATPTLDEPDTGILVVDYVPDMPGRHIAVCVTTGTGAGVAVDVVDVVATDLAIVSADDARAYLISTGPTSFTDSEITGALDAERAAQADVCRVDDWTPALREALLRRVARNLAARAVPVATWSAFDGGASGTRVPTRDPEIARLEAPFRRLTVA